MAGQLTDCAQVERLYGNMGSEEFGSHCSLSDPAPGFIAGIAQADTQTLFQYRPLPKWAPRQSHLGPHDTPERTQPAEGKAFLLAFKMLQFNAVRQFLCLILLSTTGSADVTSALDRKSTRLNSSH